MKQYWIDTEEAAMEAASSLEEVAAVAVSMLEQMKAEGKPIVQICGAMSTGGLGDFTKNMERFQHAIDTAIENGILVFDQIPFQNAIIKITNWHEGDTYSDDILEIFYRKIFESGYLQKVLFLPGWETSRGARWEHNIAINLGIPIENYPVEWL